MNIKIEDKKISPVNMESRRSLGLASGDLVRVYQKIKEKQKVRLQVFEGTVIAMKHGTEPGATFTVRRVGTDGRGVEKIYPLFSPMIDKIEIKKKIKTRRAKLYFLREKTQKQIHDKLKRAVNSTLATVSEIASEKEIADAMKREEERVVKEAEAKMEEAEAKMEEAEVKMEEEKVAKETEVKMEEVKVAKEAEVKMEEEKVVKEAEVKMEEENKPEENEATIVGDVSQVTEPKEMQDEKKEQDIVENSSKPKQEEPKDKTEETEAPKIDPTSEEAENKEQ